MSLNIQVAEIKSRFAAGISADKVHADYQHTCNFLHAYRGSAETFKSYCRETERLLQWLWFVRAKPLKDLRRTDMETFLEFCQTPPKDWIGIKHVPRFIDRDGLCVANPVWRPFISAISKKARRDGDLPDAKSY